MATLAVIMSCYNGHKYIKEQIDSILAQSFSDLKLFIRDDGSSDDTPAILKAYAESDSRIELVFDEAGKPNKNKGFGGSFSSCARYALSHSDFKYMAFCDQDDYWEKDKLSTAVSFLEKDDEKPALFASNYYICDDALKVNGTFNDGNPMEKVTFQNMFFEGVFPGFTMVMNRRLAELAFDNNETSHIYYHDKWVSLICLGMGGNIHYSASPLAKYRRHSEAESSTDLGFMKKLKWRIDKVLNGDFCPRTKQMLISFKQLFANEMDETTKAFLDIFTGSSKAKKLFYPKKLRRSATGELLIRLIILLGKL